MKQNLYYLRLRSAPTNYLNDTPDIIAIEPATNDVFDLINMDNVNFDKYLSESGIFYFDNREKCIINMNHNFNLNDYRSSVKEYSRKFNESLYIKVLEMIRTTKLTELGL